MDDRASGGMRRLVSLSDVSELSVNSDMPDVRGWSALSSDGERMGSVRELIVDRLAGRVRYLELELTGEMGGTPGERILVPIGLTILDPDEDAVRVLTVTAGSVATVERYDGEELTRSYEMRLRRSVLGASELPEELALSEREEADEGPDRFYDHEHFDERRMLAGRRAGEGEEDFSYLLGVGGAMTDQDVNPEVIGEVRAGQVHVPVVQEETRRSIAPEE